MTSKKSKQELDDEKGAPFYVSKFEGAEGEGDVYNIYIYDSILNAEQFIPAIEAFMLATSDDVVIVHLCTPGGDTQATDTFIHAMRCTDAEVMFVATGGVFSAGTIILMEANPEAVSFSEGFHAMLHNGFVGFGDKYSDWAAAAAFNKSCIEKNLRTAYKDFLTEQELDRLIAGHDYWMGADEFKARLERKNSLSSD